MREPNFSFPGQNRAAICITSSIYDRRALDCTDYIPIINTLTNLAYLTGSTPTIREYITRDGGLERLVTILKNTKVNDRKNGLKWTLAFQCVVNIGVRGTEHIRKRVVQAGMVPVIVNVLESFFAVLKSVSDENERRRLLRRAEAAQQQSQPLITDGDTNAPMLTQTHSTTTQPFGGPMTEEAGLLRQDSGLNSNDSASSAHSSASLTTPSLASTSTSVTTGSIAPSTANLPTPPSAQHPVHYPHSVPEAGQAAQDASHPDDARSIAQDGATGEARPQQFFYREDDILHSLQLLAYLSKYPSLRSSFHTESGSNVFAIVEKFTHRTMHPLEIQYWAGVIMRNACRKDDTRKGIRQCAYTGCGKWETKPREFAKCRRCRKAKYCSKQCQSKAWNEGHRWWCIEKKAETMGVSTSFGTDLPPAPPPPPPPADLQDQPDGNPNLLENNGLASLAAAGANGARMIGGGDGGSNHGHHVSQMQQSHHHQQAPAHQLNPAASSSTTPSPYSHLMAPSASRPGTSSQHQQQVPTPQQQQPQQPQQGPSQQRVPQPQPQPQQQPLPQHHSQPYHQHQQPPQHHQLQHHHQNQQPERSHQQVSPRRLQGSPEPMQSLERQPQQAAPLDRRPFNPQQMMPGQAGPSPIAHHHLHRTPQRSMSTPHPSTAPIMSTLRSELAPHLGISPDSPTPEQLAQRFVQQVALHPGQHNELAQHLHAQFQQYFPPHNQAEAKRQFSFHAREHFARYQRQQELLRSGAQGPSSGSHNVAGRPVPGRAPVMPLATPPQSQKPLYGPVPQSTGASRSGRGSETHRQGTSRRRSDLDSDDDDSAMLESGSHSTSSLSVPMLTQDLSTLSTTMSLSSTEISGPLPVSPVESRFSAGSSLGSSSSINVDDSRSDLAKSESSSSLRDFKVRKLMSPEQSASSSSSSSSHGHHGSSSGLPSQQVLQRRDEWSYSRHMAKDAPTAP
ncbi:hypothetical protein EC957_000128 [Mortierella hygrophila]|uniref:MYND-type domain-containing protein n=1 Tax=Mortierella hygrophila TaxID=979708 RepID=A0A9P6FJ24_9FUNG|nr:hypothetical protein EC957_000005 [Mortierella hygrophila]KAF9552055.1 hypothetical protein EC957_000128 [Mortierella hygrophila]